MTGIRVATSTQVSARSVVVSPQGSLLDVCCSDLWARQLEQGYCLLRAVSVGSVWTRARPAPLRAVSVSPVRHACKHPVAWHAPLQPLQPWQGLVGVWVRPKRMLLDLYNE